MLTHIQYQIDDIENSSKANKTTILMDENGSPYSLNRDVFLFVQDGSAQILDFARGQFYGLDKIATLMVLIVLKKGVEEAVNELTKIYDVTEQSVRSDLTKLLQDLE